MQHNIRKLIFLIIPLFYSCTKESLINPLNTLLKENYIKLDQGYISDAATKIEIWGQKNYFTGYNKLAFLLYDSVNQSKSITDAHVLLLPLLYSGLGNSVMISGSPAESPAEVPVNGVFPGAIVFTEPTGQNVNWKLKVAAHNHDNDKSGEADFDIVVDNPDLIMLTSFTSQSPDSTSLILTMIPPENLKAGINDIEFSLFSAEGNSQFVPEDSYSFVVNQSMPGSVTDLSGNVNPISSGNGHYKGKVNLPNGGLWDIGVLVKKADRAISKNIIFKIQF
jgi:hypothetical protein